MDDARWRREEALTAARRKLAEAEALVEAAESILRANGYEAYALDAHEALDYIHGALGG